MLCCCPLPSSAGGQRSLISRPRFPRHCVLKDSSPMTCLPKFYFHCTIAYNILRHCGIEVGKRDFIGTPVTL
jgi:hypothetical protein